MGIFDSVRLYNSEWTEVNSRKFTPEECAAVQNVTVVASQYGKSACFVFTNGKRFIPLEPTADVCLGDVLDIRTLQVVALKYTGTNDQQKTRDVLRIRVIKERQPEVTFDNPFGIQQLIF